MKYFFHAQALDTNKVKSAFIEKLGFIVGKSISWQICNNTTDQTNFVSNGETRGGIDGFSIFLFAEKN